MSGKYLDKVGLSHLVDKIKLLINDAIQSLRSDIADSNYLPKSGGELTGQIQFKNLTAMPNSSTSTDFYAVGLKAFTNGGGVCYKGVNDFKDWIELDNYMPLSGGTFTGGITVKGATIYAQNTNSSFDRDGSNPSSALYGSGLTINDKDGERVGFIRANRLTDGTMQIQLSVCNENTSGTELSNHLILGIDRSGNRSVSIAESAPWRSALGLETPVKSASGNATAGTNITLTYCYVATYGKVAHLIASIKATAAISAGSTVFTIVSGKRPVYEAFALCSTPSVAFYISTSGTMVARSALTNGTTYYIQATYILA